MAVIQLDPLPRNVDRSVLFISGTKSPEVVRIDIDGRESAVEISGNRWTGYAKLKPGKNEILIEPYAPGDSKLLSTTATVYLQKIQTEYMEVYGDLDVWGDEFNLSRRANEKNQPYRKRLIDKGRLTSAVTKRGVAPALSTELSLKNHFEIFGVSVIKAGGKPKVSQTFARTTDSHFELTCREMRTTEILTVPVVSMEVQLSRKLASTSRGIVVYNSGGQPVSQEDYRIDNHDSKIFFYDSVYSGKDIKVEYNYWERIPLRGETLAQLIADVNAIQVNGDFVFQAESPVPVSPLMNEPAQGLSPHEIPLPVNPKNGLPSTVSRHQGIYTNDIIRVQVKTLATAKGLYVNARGTIYDAPMEYWYGELTKNDGMIWGRATFRRDRWQSEAISPHMNFFPHLLDPKRGYRFRHGHREELTQSQWLTLGKPDVKLHGPSPDDWNSGVGTEDDLFVQLTEITDQSVEDYILQDDLSRNYGIIRSGVPTTLPGVK